MTKRKNQLFRFGLERLEARELMAADANRLPDFPGPRPQVSALTAPRLASAGTAAVAAATVTAAPSRMTLPFGGGSNAYAHGKLDATFDWEMQEWTGPNFDFDGDGVRGDIPNVREYVHPSGYGVNFRGRALSNTSGSRIVSYNWVIDAAGTEDVPLRAAGQNVTLLLPEGRYDVTLRVANSAEDVIDVKESIIVNNILVVSMGDSYASGEGNPHQHRLNLPVDLVTNSIGPAKWADGGSRTASLQNDYAHRSVWSAPAQAAYMLERQDPHTSVTFVSVAATGAKAGHLYAARHTPESQFTIDPMTGELVPVAGLPLDPQVDQLAALLADDSSPKRQREIDTLFVSAGGNDIEFTNLIGGLLLHDPRYATSLVRSVVNGAVDVAFDIITLDCFFGILNGCDKPKDLIKDAYNKALDLYEDYAPDIYDWAVEAGLVVVDAFSGTTLSYENYLASLPGRLRARISGLIASYGRLADAIEQKLNVADENIQITGYPDPALDSSRDGMPDRIMDDTYLDGFEIDAREIALAKKHAIRPLNRMLSDIANSHDWNYVDVQNVMLDHGYGARDSWFVTWDDAIDRQGWDSSVILVSKGVMHPNEKGARAMAVRMADAAFGELGAKVYDNRGANVSSITREIPISNPFLGVQEIRVQFNEDLQQHTLDASDVTITGPKGERVSVLSVMPAGWMTYTDGRSREFVIRFRPTTFGDYTVKISSQVLDMFGNWLDTDLDGRNGLRHGNVDMDAITAKVRVFKGNPVLAPSGGGVSSPSTPSRIPGGATKFV